MSLCQKSPGTSEEEGLKGPLGFRGAEGGGGCGNFLRFGFFLALGLGFRNSEGWGF